MWDTIKDYMSAFLGALALFLSLVFIPEIGRKIKYIVGVIILCLVLTGLGIDKIGRDDRKGKETEERMKKMQSDLRTISDSYGKDTTRFIEFKRQLEKDFHIKDSENIPIQIHNYKPTFNTHIDKARDVKIG